MQQRHFGTSLNLHEEIGDRELKVRDMELEDERDLRMDYDSNRAGLLEDLDRRLKAFLLKPNPESNSDEMEFLLYRIIEVASKGGSLQQIMSKLKKFLKVVSTFVEKSTIKQAALVNKTFSLMTMLKATREYNQGVWLDSLGRSNHEEIICVCIRHMLAHYDKLSTADIALTSMQGACLSNNNNNLKMECTKKAEEFLETQTIKDFQGYDFKTIQDFWTVNAAMKTNSKDQLGKLEIMLVGALHFNKEGADEYFKSNLNVRYFISLLAECKVQNKELWARLLKDFIALLNNDSMTLKDVSWISYSLYAVYLKTPKVWQNIVDYLDRRGYTADDFVENGCMNSVNMIYSIVYAYNDVRNERFASEVQKFLEQNIKFFNLPTTRKALSIVKMWAPVQDKNMIEALDRRLETVIEKEKQRVKTHKSVPYPPREKPWQ